jgi:iduronate 2-sulfatase
MLALRKRSMRESPKAAEDQRPPLRSFVMLPRFLLSLVFIVVTSLPGIGADKKPNVLFIMADDLRCEVGCYGSPAITPNIDRLAKRSVQFDRAFCQQAVCNPSRSSLLTGCRPDTLRLWNNGTHFRELNPDVTTIPLWFKEHGYVTRCTGKIFHNWHTKEHGDPRSWSAPEFLHYANHGDDKPEVSGELPPNLATLTPLKYGNTSLCESRDVPDEAYYDGQVANEAIRVLNEIKDKPFFLALGMWKPHAPFNAPKKYWDLYDRAKLPPLNPARPEGAPEIAFHKSTEILGPPDKQVPPTPEQSAEIRHGYFANISYMDAQIGKVIDALEKLGLADNTIVIFISDHGYHLGEHTLWGKTSNFEFDAHVPFLISDCGIKNTRGMKTKSLVESLDLFPTLVDLCGLPKPAQIEGTSLAPILRDVNATIRPAAYTQHPRPAYYDREPSKTPIAMGCSVRTARVRYTEWREHGTGKILARELYDSTNDPNELRNAVGDTALEDARVEAEMLLKKRFP